MAMKETLYPTNMIAIVTGIDNLGRDDGNPYEGEKPEKGEHLRHYRGIKSYDIIMVPSSEAVLAYVTDWKQLVLYANEQDLNAAASQCAKMGVLYSTKQEEDTFILFAPYSAKLERGLCELEYHTHKVEEEEEEVEEKLEFFDPEPVSESEVEQEDEDDEEKLEFFDSEPVSESESAVDPASVPVCTRLLDPELVAEPEPVSAPVFDTAAETETEVEPLAIATAAAEKAERDLRDLQSCCSPAPQRVLLDTTVPPTTTTLGNDEYEVSLGNTDDFEDDDEVGLDDTSDFEDDDGVDIENISDFEPESDEEEEEEEEFEISLGDTSDFE